MLIQSQSPSDPENEQNDWDFSFPDVEQVLKTRVPLLQVHPFAVMRLLYVFGGNKKFIKHFVNNCLLEYPKAESQQDRIIDIGWVNFALGETRNANGLDVLIHTEFPDQEDLLYKTATTILRMIKKYQKEEFSIDFIKDELLSLPNFDQNIFNQEFKNVVSSKHLVEKKLGTETLYTLRVRFWEFSRDWWH